MREECQSKDEKPDAASAIDIEALRRELLDALNHVGDSDLAKQAIRQHHLAQRQERAKAECRLLQQHGEQILEWFANGTEVTPAKIRPYLLQVTDSASAEGSVFRAATLLWSIPVSRGYGRRMRYLVMDRQNDKLIGLLALGDPVFNLRCRDEWIGWNSQQRRDRLAFTMDAYVLGATPPYSKILGGKLIGAMVASKDIQEDFRARYGGSTGLISQTRKNPHLALVTTTSALGRSSIYNRLRLPNAVDFVKLGFTSGWGHFQIGDDLFNQLRSVLEHNGHRYHNNHRYGQGPNWKLRALRQACRQLGVDSNLLRHGIRREVYGIPLATNWREVLLGQEPAPIRNPATVEDLGAMAVDRWVSPRAVRDSSYRTWTRTDTWQLLTQYACDANILPRQQDTELP